MSAGLASLSVPLALATQGSGQAAPGFPWPLIAGMLLIIYFMMMRPQMKEQKARRAMLSALKKDDKVITSSGIFGQIVTLDDQTVTLKVDDNVRIKFTRDAIIRAVEEPVADPA